MFEVQKTIEWRGGKGIKSYFESGWKEWTVWATLWGCDWKHKGKWEDKIIRNQQLFEQSWMAKAADY